MDFSRFVGLGYEERGSGPQTFDCWGLFRAAYEAGTGLSLAAFDPYSGPVELSPAALEGGPAIPLAWTVLESPGALRAYDAVLMAIRRKYHVGLMVDRQNMLHIQRGKTSVIEPVSRYSSVVVDFMRSEELT